MFSYDWIVWMPLFLQQLFRSISCSFFTKKLFNITFFVQLFLFFFFSNVEPIFLWLTCMERLNSYKFISIYLALTPAWQQMEKSLWCYIIDLKSDWSAIPSLYQEVPGHALTRKFYYWPTHSDIRTFKPAPDFHFHGKDSFKHSGDLLGLFLFSSILAKGAKYLPVHLN